MNTPFDDGGSAFDVWNVPKEKGTSPDVIHHTMRFQIYSRLSCHFHTVKELTIDDQVLFQAGLPVQCLFRRDRLLLRWTIRFCEESRSTPTLKDSESLAKLNDQVFQIRGGVLCGLPEQ